MSLILALLTQAVQGTWSDDLAAALAQAREREAVLAVAVMDDSPASRETLRSFEADSVRPLVAGYIRVRVPAGTKESIALGVRWAPTVFLFQGRREPPATPEDQACLKRLRETRVSVDFQDAPLEAVADYLREIGKVHFRIHESIRSVQTPIDLKKADAPLDEVVRAAAEAVGMEYAVLEGHVVLADKEKLPELTLRRDLDAMRVGRLEGLPPADLRVTDLLRRRIDLDLRGVDRLRDAAARWNAALGEEIVQPTDSMARAFVRETRFKNCDSFTILDHLDCEPKPAAYRKGGNLILSDKPELVALTPERLRGWIVDSLECEETHLPPGAAREIETLAAHLSSDSPQDREKATEGLQGWVQRTATSKTVLRRLLVRTADPEVRARLTVLLALKRIPQN